MIKQAVVATLLKDDSPYPRSFANYNGKSTYYTRLSPYGLDTHPPRDSIVLLLSSQAQESNKYGIASDMLNRFKNLAEHEVVLYNTATKDYVYLKEDGNIEIYANADIVVNAENDIKVEAGGNIEAIAAGSVDAEAGTTLTAKAATSATIEAPNIVLTGNVTVNGTFSQTGGGAGSFSGSLNVANDASINGRSFMAHSHSGVQSGTSNTGGVN